MIELVIAAVVIPLALISLFAISDALTEQRAERERAARPDLPSYVRRIHHPRPFDWERDT